MIFPVEDKSNGFTLLEVILTLVIAGVVGSMLVTYFGTSLTQSPTPVHRLQNALDLQRTIENITADYNQSDRTATALATLQNSIGAEGSTQNNAYTQNQYTYTVIHNRFIKFSGNSEADADVDQDLLKVTLQNDSGETLTVLFAGKEN